MKHLRKMMALVIAMVMALTASNVALAAGEGSITISNATVDKKYDAFKIFDLTYSGETGSENIAYTIDSDWKNFFKSGGDGAAYISDTQTGNLNQINIDGNIKYINITESNKNEFAAKALAYATNLTPDQVVTATATSVTLSGLDLGYYLVYPEGASGMANGQASICSLDSTLPTATINAKAVYPTVDKEIVEGSDRVNVSEASIGDTITYEITSTVPDYTGYKWYKLVFADTLAKGLTYGSLTSITIGNTTLNDNAYTVAVGNYDATNGTSIRYIIKDIVAANYTAGDKITITYTATLNENAVINGPNKNTVVLEYTNDPKWTNDHDKDGDDFQPTDPKGVTPVDETETYTTAVKINKTDGKSNALTGAEFQITGDGVNVVVTTGDVYVEDTAGTYWKLNDGTYTTDDPTTEGMDTTKYASQTIKYKKETQAVLHTKGTDAVDAKAFVDANGELIFQGLGIGTYTISETVVPAGYNKAEDVVFTLTFDANNKVFISDNNTVTLEAATNMFKTTIVNNAGAELPSTGGIGTTIFYIVGGVMVAGAVVFLLTKRRVAGNE